MPNYQSVKLIPRDLVKNWYAQRMIGSLVTNVNVRTAGHEELAVSAR